MTRAVGRGCVEQVDGRCTLWVPKHDVDVAGPFLDQVTVLLGEAPADHDLELGRAVLHGLQMAERAVELVVGVLPDAAGVEHDDVGVVDAGGGHACRRPRAGPASRSESCSFIWHPKVRIEVPLGHRASLRGPDRRPRSQHRSMVSVAPLRLALRTSSTPLLDNPRGSRRWARPEGGRPTRGHAELARVEGDRQVVGVEQVDVGRPSASSDSSSTPMPTSARTRSEISTMISGLSMRNCLAFSRPWPSCSPS